MTQPFHTLALIGSFGVPELLIIFAILLLLFGYSRLPQLGRGLGEGIRNFRHGLKSGDAAAKEEEAAETPPNKVG
jgi:sec-independent protein translocase protein TatA